MPHNGKDDDEDDDDAATTTSDGSSSGEGEEGDTDAGSSESTSNLTFHPAYCFKASPTWFTWVKLTAFDVHYNLEVQSQYYRAGLDTKDFTGDTLLLFYHNHPVRFVQLVGVVVNVENYYEKYWLFTVDDSSGATIDVTCRKPVVPDPNQKDLVDDLQQPRKKAKEDPDESARAEVMTKLENGIVVQVKGQISTFRRVRQLQLERIAIVSDTNQEMQLVAARSAFHRSVLSGPWVVSETTKARLLKEATDEKEASKSQILRLRQRAQDREEREKRHEARILAKYERDEARRAAAAAEAKAAGELLRAKQKPT